MPTRPRLSENQRCIATIGKLRCPGVVHELVYKGYVVRLDNGSLQKVRETRVKPAGPPPKKAARAKVDPQHQRPSVVAAARARPQPVHIPDPPEECDWWLRYVRTLPCGNCPRPAPSEAHHEGKKGVSQKVRDTMAVALCTACHFVLTKTNRLPARMVDRVDTVKECDLRTREESLRILQAEQDRLLTAAIEKLEQPARIEVLSKAMARVEKLCG